MKKSNLPPLISVCIPVYDTEPFLAQCLRSVIRQDFDSFEVVVVSDASRGKDVAGHTAKKIVKLAQKECDKLRKAAGLASVSIRFLEHRENRGILEVRRTLVYEAKGEYICFVDSDDELASGALNALCKDTSFDIVQGNSVSGSFDSEENFIPSEKNRYCSAEFGIVEGHEIFHKWVSSGIITGMVWAKLIRRNLLELAFANIPYTECNMGDDYLISFFVMLNAKRYCGTKTEVYHYRITNGMSSKRKIDSLRKWKLVCSAASIFTIISQWLEEHGNNTEILPEEMSAIRLRARNYLANNITQMEESVIPELKTEARAMLCEYWGTDFVEEMEKIITCRLS
jgi:glycosyltransferase involved in cell wall biosynthesis